jgi:hypothetical protein
MRAGTMETTANRVRPATTAQLPRVKASGRRGDDRTPCGRCDSDALWRRRTGRQHPRCPAVDVPHGPCPILAPGAVRTPLAAGLCEVCGRPLAGPPPAAGLLLPVPHRPLAAAAPALAGPPRPARHARPVEAAIIPPPAADGTRGRRCAIPEAMTLGPPTPPPRVRDRGPGVRPLRGVRGGSCQPSLQFGVTRAKQESQT